MISNKIYSTEELAKTIHTCSQEQFTGLLLIEKLQGQRWNLYFHQGALMAGSSKEYAARRWCRQLYKHYPQLSFEVVSYWSEQLQNGNYHFFAELLTKGTSRGEEMAPVIASNTTEILFDIIQQGKQLCHNSVNPLICKRILEDTINSKLIVMEASQAWQQAIEAWEAWHKAGFAHFSPNLAPEISQVQQLRQHTSVSIYNNLSKLLDGNLSLRDLALKLKQNPLPLTQSIMPYIHKGWINLIEVEDSCLNLGVDTVTRPKLSITTNPQPTPANRTVSKTKPTTNAPLIAYIDDSSIDSQRMNLILTQAGYRYLNIQDSVMALPTLLEQKPKLIFLDLVMPIANGYEICAQIRRVSMFRETPVIILTGNDGIVDRVRAKIVGSTGFLAKPITPEKVIKTLQDYLSVQKPISSRIENTS
ncbi:MAG: response regulator [Symploca sp. SIO1C4]|uniref:Response regulator n=1 Tax=Symploca sp. SIO1C4 TaxID=2607765 RepID=A0A6B3NF08_9CYAN|nr:response regulator [Symploca sp. SIO1C4]